MDFWVGVAGWVFGLAFLYGCFLWAVTRHVPDETPENSRHDLVNKGAWGDRGRA